MLLYNEFINIAYEITMLKKIPVQVRFGILFLAFFLCSYIAKECFRFISPGHVGVLINMFGNHKSDDQVLSVGFHIVLPWKKIYEFPIFEQNKTWEKEDSFNFQTAEGLSVNAEVGITYHLKQQEVPRIFQKYRAGISEITNTFIRNYIRDAINKSASHFKIEELYSSAKEKFFEEVQKTVSHDLNELGINVSRIYLIGQFHFPKNVIAALNAKIEANQRAQQRENELREAEAEAKKKIANANGEAESMRVKAKAQAESNKLLTDSISEPLIKWQATQKWDGKMPRVTGGAVPFIEIPK